MITMGFEPTPVKTSALNWRLRPLGHVIDSIPTVLLRDIEDCEQMPADLGESELRINRRCEVNKNADERAPLLQKNIPTRL